MSENIIFHEERLTAPEYIDFLKRTDLGSQYPAERFEQRIEKLVASVPVSVTARNEAGLVVGVLFAVTDFAYWMFVTDLGVDRAYTHRGIGRELLRRAHDLAGGADDIMVYLVANENAVPFYEKLDFTRADDVMTFNRMPWTPFTVQ